jgi:segregation and condensation protein A
MKSSARTAARVERSEPEIRERAPGEGEVHLDLPAAGFEGPLDLLLHLIQQHELDILNIPVSFVTERFLVYLDLMRTLSIDVASEYLVMAATLAHIKSKMLLPEVPADQDADGDEEELDPRSELVRRLLEYQKYKAAAADLGARATLGKDVFGRGSAEPVPEGPAPFADLGVFNLLDAFERVLKRANVKLDHEVVFDRISITDRMNQLVDTLKLKKRAAFEELLFTGLEKDARGVVRTITRFDLVITFLAVLEMCKLRMLKVYQVDVLSPIHLELTVAEADDPTEPRSGFHYETEPHSRSVDETEPHSRSVDETEPRSRSVDDDDEDDREEPEA